MTSWVLYQTWVVLYRGVLYKKELCTPNLWLTFYVFSFLLWFLDVFFLFYGVLLFLGVLFFKNREKKQKFILMHKLAKISDLKLGKYKVIMRVNFIKSSSLADSKTMSLYLDFKTESDKVFCKSTYSWKHYEFFIILVYLL